MLPKVDMVAETQPLRSGVNLHSIARWYVCIYLVTMHINLAAPMIELDSQSDNRNSELKAELDRRKKVSGFGNYDGVKKFITYHRQNQLWFQSMIWR